MTAAGRHSGAVITPDQLLDRLDHADVAILEITSGNSDDYRRCHIPGAAWANWQDLLWDDLARQFRSPDQLAERLGALGIGADAELIVYGAPVQFGTYAYWALRLAGQRNVAVLDGGKHRWLELGLPITSVLPDLAAQPPRPHSGTDPAIRANREVVRAAIGDEGIRILDVRTPEEYRGERVSPSGSLIDTGAQRAGHVPGARNIYFRSFLNDDDTFRSATEIRALLDRHGVSEADEVIAYCRLSHRASAAWFAMTEIAGRPSVRVYDGSWTEWGSIVGVPIER
jgi:thiosulfate/3-mercaptopyruvate sulfurtransferase